MSEISRPFMVGSEQLQAGPLHRFLPLLPAGMAAAWLERQEIPRGSWIIDPFGASPGLALEVARAGYNVLVAVNNPIISFVLETLASAPSLQAFQSALSELAATRKGEGANAQRLELHIQSLYLVDCPKCGSQVPARAFFWNSQKLEANPASTAPELCQIECLNCGENSEVPVSQGNLERLEALLRGSGLHRARALERVSAADEGTRPNVEAALNTYLPRPLYALFTLINKLEGLPTSSENRRLLTALLISAADEANTLWSHPAARARPRLLTTPPVFRENNLWQSMESAADQWQSSARRVPVTRWPRLPAVPGGSICLFPGRFKELADQLGEDFIPHAIITAFPRPNQAFWTLSALWAGWLWGREAAAPLKIALARQRFDWAWHTTALSSTLGSVARAAGKLPFFGLIAEYEPAFLSALLTATNRAGMILDGFALRSEQDIAQLRLTLTPEGTLPKEINEATSIRQAVEDHLADRAEPAGFSHLHAAALTDLSSRGILGQGEKAEGQAARIQASLRSALSDKSLLARFGASRVSDETGVWVLQKPLSETLSLSDRVEMDLVRFLNKNPGVQLSVIDQALCDLYPGLLTPPLELIHSILDSYAEPNAEGGWKIAESETPAARRRDIQEITQLLRQLGTRLGYKVEGDSPIRWVEDKEDDAYSFHVIASAVISRFLSNRDFNSKRSLIIIPGSRSNLLTYKLKHNPHLEQATSPWCFVKYRSVRRLATSAYASHENWLQLLQEDPLEYRATQMEIFPRIS